MSIIATKENQINLYICNEDALTKRVIAYAKSSKATLYVVDVCKSKLTGTEWLELASKAGLSVSDFIQVDHPTFKYAYKDNCVSLDENSAIKVLNNHPEVLVYPIALRGKKAVLCKSEATILELQTSDTGEVRIP